MRFLQQAYEIAAARAEEGIRMRRLAAYVLIDLSTVNFVVGRIDQAREYGVRAANTFRALDHRSMLADAFGSVGDA